MNDLDNQVLANNEFAFQMLSNNTADGVPTEIVKKVVADIEKKFGFKPEGYIATEKFSEKRDELYKSHPEAKDIFKSEFFQMWKHINKIEDTQDIQDAVKVLNKFILFRESLAPHQKRVIEERDELDEKIAKLGQFIYSQTRDELPEIEVLRLGMQLKVMNFYSEILGTRIVAFMK